MNPMKLMAAVLGLALLLFAGSIASRTASAQYPGDQDFLNLKILSVTVACINTNASWVLDLDSDDFVPGETGTVAIASEPSSQVSLGGSKSVTKALDGNGVMTGSLFTGDKPGTIILKGDAHKLTAQSALIVIDSGQCAPVVAATAPSGAVAAALVAPKTGDAGLADGSSWTAYALPAVVAVLGSALLAVRLRPVKTKR